MKYELVVFPLLNLLFLFSFTDSLPLVVAFAPLAESQHDLDELPRLHFQWNDRHPLLLKGREEPLLFCPLEEKLAILPGVVVRKTRGECIRGDLGTLEDGLRAQEGDVGPREVHMPLATGFHLLSCEYDAGLHGVRDLVVISCATVLRNDLHKRKYAR